MAENLNRKGKNTSVWKNQEKLLNLYLIGTIKCVFAASCTINIILPSLSYAVFHVKEYIVFYVSV